MGDGERTEGIHTTKYKQEQNVSLSSARDN